MPLDAPSPVTIPAIPEKTFPNQWIYNLLVHAPTYGTGRISLELLPYSDARKEIGPSELMETIRTDEFFACVQEVPQAAQAYGAVLAAVPHIRTWLAKRAEENQP